jgi:hypothetical protein
MLLDISFSPSSLSQIAQLAGFEVFLGTEMATAMQQAGDLLTQAAQAKTWEFFAHPTGELAGTIVPILDSPFEVRVGSDSPHAWRREAGFVGADSLGRVYDDKGFFYMQSALDENQQPVLILVESATERALARIGGNA